MFTIKDDSPKKYANFICYSFVIMLFASSLSVFFDNLSLSQKIITFIASQLPACFLLLTIIVSKKSILASGYLLIVGSICFSIYIGTYKNILCFIALTLPLLIAGVINVFVGMNHIY